jgi:hypothetical protein
MNLSRRSKSGSDPVPNALAVLSARVTDLGSGGDITATDDEHVLICSVFSTIALFGRILVCEGIVIGCNRAPPKHRDPGHGLKFGPVHAVTGQNRHAILNGLHEAGKRINIG